MSCQMYEPCPMDWGDNVAPFLENYYLSLDLPIVVLVAFVLNSIFAIVWKLTLPFFGLPSL